MSKDRARRRAERMAVADRERVARARAVQRRQRRRAVLQRLTPTIRRRRTGRMFARRTRGQRVAIGAATIGVLGAVWLWIPDPALRVLLTVVLLLTLPVFVVLILDRRT